MEEHYRCIELPITIAEFHRLPRNAAYKYEYLDGRAVPSSVRWVSNQRSRWGSCTPAEGSIRLSD